MGIMHPKRHFSLHHMPRNYYLLAKTSLPPVVEPLLARRGWNVQLLRRNEISQLQWMRYDFRRGRGSFLTRLTCCDLVAFSDTTSSSDSGNAV